MDIFYFWQNKFYNKLQGRGMYAHVDGEEHYKPEKTSSSETSRYLCNGKDKVQSQLQANVG